MSLPPSKTKTSVESQKVLTLWLLKQSGPYEDKSGFAVAPLFNDYRSYGGNRELRSYATLLSSLEAEGCLLRDIKGKRTFAIVLVDLKDYAAQVGVLGEGKPQPVQPEPEDDQAERVPEPPVPTGPSASEVAAELLAEVVSILERPRAYEFNQQSLREARDQAESYKRKLVEAEAEIVDLRRKIADGTKKLLVCETNLAAVMRDKGSSVRHETVKALDKVMRQTPTGRGE